MGSFNRVGFYSNLPIFWEDEVMVFICAINKKYLLSNTSIPMIIDENAFPVCMPISCDYDGYGGGKCNDYDANVKFIEKAFGDAKIEDIIRKLSNSNFEYDEDITDTKDSTDISYKINEFMKKYNLTDCVLFITMERKDVYDEMVQISNKPFFSLHNLEGSRIGSYWLTQLGFIESYNQYPDYIKEYHLNNYDGEYYVQSTGIFPKIVNDYKVVGQHVNNIGDFIHQWESITNTKLQYDKKIEEYNIVDISFDLSKKAYNDKKSDVLALDDMDFDNEELINKFGDDIIESINKVRTAFEEIKHSSKNESILTESFAYSNKMPNDISFIGVCSCLHVPQACLIYDGDTLFSTEFKNIVTNFVKFNLTLSRFCGYYTLSSYGSQQLSDIDMLKDIQHLHNQYSKIIDEKLKKRLKDEEELSF